MTAETPIRPQPVPAALEAFLPHLERVHERRKAGRLPGIPTSLPSVDKQMGGLQTGIHLLAAEPGAGKTTLALQIARAAAVDGAAVTYLALDEGGDRLALKVVAGCAGLSPARYLNGLGDIREIRQAMEVHHDTVSRIEICSGLVSPTDAGAMIRARMDMVGADEGLLIVDFLQAWASRMSKVVGDYRIAVSQLVGELRQVALAQQVPILCIVAQNRSGMGEAKMSSLRESSDLEYTADTISMLVTEKMEEERYAIGDNRRVEFTCVKNRWGGFFSVPLIFDPAMGAFGEQRR